MIKRFTKKNLKLRFEVIKDLTSSNPSIYKTNRDAAYKLDISIRQVQRLKKQFDGSFSSIEHLNKHTPKRKKFTHSMLDEIIFIVRSWNKNLEDAALSPLLYSHAHNKIKDHFGISMSYSYFRNLCINNNLLSCQISPHLIDNSLHLPSEINKLMKHGFEWQADGTFDFTIVGSGLSLCAHVIVDAASNTIISIFLDTQETNFGYLNAFKQAFEKYGRPSQVAADKRSSFSNNHSSEKRSALMKRIFDELNISLRLTSNPRSKNKVESKNSVVKNHIMKELALLNASTIEEANNLLPDVINKINSYLSNEIDDDNVLRDMPNDYDYEIEFSEQYERTSQANCSIAFENNTYVAINNNTEKIINFKRGSKVTILENYQRELFTMYNGSKCKLVLATKENTNDLILENQKKDKRVIKDDNYTVNWKKKTWHFINQYGVSQQFKCGNEVIFYYKYSKGVYTPIVATINNVNYNIKEGEVHRQDTYEIISTTCYDSTIQINNNLYKLIDINRNELTFNDCEIHVEIKNSIPSTGILNSTKYSLINVSI